MKNLFKLLYVTILFFTFTISAEAQVKHRKTEKKEIKKDNLSKRDKEVRKTFKKSIKQEKESIKKNSALTREQKKAQLEELKNEKHDKL